MRILRLSALVSALLLLPSIAQMQPIQVPLTLGTTPCVNATLSLFCSAYINGVNSLVLLITNTLFPGAQIVFFAIACVLFVQYGLRLMFESGDESTITETKSAYTYGITGMVVVSVATMIAHAVGQSIGAYPNSSGHIVDANQIGSTLGTIVFYIETIIATAVSGVVVYQAFRLVLSQGQDSEMEQQKKRFLHALIGVAIILLAVPIVRAVVPSSNPNLYTNAPTGSSISSTSLGANGQGDIGLVATQIVGIANFLLVFLGGLSVLAFIVAGGFLVFSVNEELKERAKKTIFTTTIAMIVTLSIYAILKFVVGLV